MHLASQAAHHHGVPVLSRAQSEEFVTVRSFGRLEGGAGEEGLRG